MIEITDEMTTAALHALPAYAVEAGGLDVEDMVTVVAAAMAFVEARYVVTPMCGESLTPELRCHAMPFHEGEHEALAPTGSRVTWTHS